MLENVKTFALAKINLGLKVKKARSDGFHNIASIFSTVNLRDEITVSLTDENNHQIPDECCKVDCKSEIQENFVLPNENTFSKAYKAFCVLTGNKKGVYVKLKKRIPVGGGLGGGSSDASSFIQSLNLLFGTQLAESAQMEIAGKVGSDCFFFTKSFFDSKTEDGSYAAFVEGRGEKVSKIEMRNDYFVLLLMPEVSVSTKIAYDLVDKYYSLNKSVSKEIFNKNNLADKEMFENIYKMPIKDWKRFGLSNDFTNPIIENYPKIKAALNAMLSLGADFVDMSGSGSTIYGIFENQEKAITAKKLLESNWKVILV